MSRDMRLVLRARGTAQAQLLFRYLDAQGFDCELRNEFSSTIPIDETRMEVWVRASELAEALLIMGDLDSSEVRGRLSVAVKDEMGKVSLAQDERRCPHCGQASPVHFGECWNCQSDFAPLDEAEESAR